MVEKTEYSKKKSKNKRRTQKVTRKDEVKLRE